MPKLTWILIGILIFLGLYSLLPRTASPTDIDFYVALRKAVVTGTIIEEPDIRAKTTRYTIAPRVILLPVTNTERRLTPSSRLLLITQKYPEFVQGDILKLTGILEKPESFGNFDYPGYLSRFGIYASMNFPEISLVEKSRESPSLLSSMRQFFESRLVRVYSTEPMTSLLEGLLIGQKRNLPETTEDSFRRAGLSHILVISGFNITLLISMIMAMLKPFGKKISLFGSGFAILFFTLFVGASPSVVRAAIMGGLSLLALAVNRTRESFLALLLAATVMAIYNPKILLFDIGFQLSFLATFGLIFVAPLLAPRLHWLPERFAIRDTMAMTLSAQLMTLPVIMMNFEQISLVAPLSNLLIAGPIIPLTMILGFFGTLGGFLSIPFGKILGYPGALLVTYLDGVAVVTAQIPFSTLETPHLGKPLLFALLVVLAAAVMLRSHKQAQSGIFLTQLQVSFEQKIFQTINLV